MILPNSHPAVLLFPEAAPRTDQPSRTPTLQAPVATLAASKTIVDESAARAAVTEVTAE